MLVSGKAALQANSDKHLTASWNESTVAEKCFSKIIAKMRIQGIAPFFYWAKQIMLYLLSLYFNAVKLVFESTRTQHLLPISLIAQNFSPLYFRSNF